MTKGTTASIARARDDVIQAGKDPVCIWRHARYKGGQTMKDIAREDGVSLSIVRDSIQAVNMFTAMFNQKVIEAGEIQMLEELRGLKRLALEAALNAEDIHHNEAGQVVSREPNVELRLRAVEILNEELDTLIGAHKGPGVAISVSQSQAQASVAASDSGMSFENVLRKIQAGRKKMELPVAAQEKLPPAQENVLDVLDVEIEVPEEVNASQPQGSIS